MAFAMQWLEFKGWLAALEGEAADFVIGFESSPRDTAHDSPEIVVFAIDDDAYAKYFNATSPLHAPGLSDLVAQIVDQRARVVGVDILTDREREPDDWKYWRTKEHPVVWAAGGENRDVRAPGFWHWFAGAHEEIFLVPGHVLGAATPAPWAWGVPLYPSDRDRQVRRVARSWRDRRFGMAAPPSEDTFSRVVAKMYCGKAGCPESPGDETFLSPARTPPLVPLTDSFKCAEDSPSTHLCATWKYNGLPGALRDRIVLLGGTFATARDAYATPLGPATPGVVLNAQAVAAEIAGHTIHELPPWGAFLLDVGVGLMFGAVLNQKNRVSKGLLIALILVGLLGLAFCLMFFLRIVWIAWAAMMLVGFAWHVVGHVVFHSGHKA